MTIRKISKEDLEDWVEMRSTSGLKYFNISRAHVESPPL